MMRIYLATIIGKLAFASVFGVIIVWLMLIPAEQIHPDAKKVVWWRSVRFWAIVVALSQLLLYACWPG